MLRICDLTGPASVYATRLFAELGHDIVRVEDPRGDVVRRRAPFLGGEPDLEVGAYHQYLNAGKRSLTLDTGSGAAGPVLSRLANWADVVILDTSRHVDESLLTGSNPDLVLSVVSDGEPSELVLAARSGLLRLTGHPGQPPVLLGGNGVIHAVTGTYVAIATAAAILGRERAGSGVRVGLSVLDCLASLTEQAMISYLTEGEVADRVGNRGAVTGVSGALPARDGYWVLSVPPSRDVWEGFVKWVGDPELLADESLADEAERRAKAEFIRARLQAWAVERGRDDLVEDGQVHRMPATPVTTTLDLVREPQLAERGFLRRQDHPRFGATTVAAGALGTLRRTAPGPAPSLGEHNAEILEELGYSAEERAILFESGVV